MNLKTILLIVQAPTALARAKTEPRLKSRSSSGILGVIGLIRLTLCGDGVCSRIVF
jgi:hypothetical protein